MSGATQHATTQREYNHFHERLRGLFTKDTDSELTAATFSQIPEGHVARTAAAALFKPPIKDALGTDAMLWQPYRDGDIVPEAGAHSNLDGAPEVLTGYMADEWVMFENMPMGGVPGTREKAHPWITPFLRAYFHWTKNDETPGDVEKWHKYAGMLYDAIESGRKARGLSVDGKAVARGMVNLLMFEEPSFCLSRDTKSRSYVIHYKDDAHGADIGLLFRGGHPDIVQFSSELHPVVDDDRLKRSDQVIDALASFAKTGTPTVSGVESWDAYPMAMHLQKENSAAQPFGEELQEFQNIKQEIVDDLGIDTVLPQNL